MDIRREDFRNRNRWQVAAIRARLRLICFLLVAGYLALAGRLAYLQIAKHAYFLGLAYQIRQHTIVLPADRGEIFDRNGNPLAVDIAVGDIIADPTEIADCANTASALAQCIPTADAGTLSSMIQAAQAERTPAGKPLRYLVLAKSVPYAAIRNLEQQMRADQHAHLINPANPDALTGITVLTHSVRSYPNGDLAAQVLGFVSKGPDGQMSGAYGVEKSFNSVLTGHDGLLRVETDAQGHVLAGTESDHVSPRNGRNIRLTIDSYIQAVAQRELAKSVETYHAKTGCVVVIDPENGDILADANLPTFDPNDLGASNYADWDDRVVSDLYEPGSTMKTLTMSAVLDSEGLDEMNHTIFCSGEWAVGGHIIHCAPDPPLYGHHGLEDMRKVLENSCNIGAAQFAMGLGADKLFEYDQAFGLLEKPDCGLPGAEHSYLQSPQVKPWSKIELANIAFGQGISITPLQLASIYATVANGGRRVYPHIIEGAPVGPPVQVIKPEVAQAMLSMLQSVVTDGTGEPAQIANFTIGGKTGSAQVAEHGHYGDQYVGSFCGIAPLTHPRLVILCAIFKPSGIHWGAVVAAPVVHDIAKEALAYMKTPPDALGTQDYDDKSRKPGEGAFVTVHIPAPGPEEALASP